VTARKRGEKVFRPGKTQEDRMPVGQRPRVEAANNRAKQPNHMRCRAAELRVIGGR